MSQAGYDYDPQRPSSTAFLPLLPMLMAAGTRVGLDRYWVGLMAVNLAFAVGLACFGRAVLRTTGDCGTTWRSCLLLTAYPYALYFSAPYQESLGFALITAAILAWSVQRPIAASISLSLSSLARLTTAAMCLGLVAEWLDDKVHRRPPRNSAWLVALSGGLGFGLFCAIWPCGLAILLSIFGLTPPGDGSPPAFGTSPWCSGPSFSRDARRRCTSSSA